MPPLQFLQSKSAVRKRKTRASTSSNRSHNDEIATMTNSGHSASGSTGSNKQRRTGRDTKKQIVIPAGHFDSVLDKPFSQWNQIETVLTHIIPELDHHQRSQVIRSLIHFLELKVVMEEFIPGNLLSPSNIVARAWGALILETKLYKRVTARIQDFHGKARRTIHHSVLEMGDKRATKERLDRTQSLFHCYFGEAMLTSLDEPDDKSLSVTSALTETTRMRQLETGFSGCGFTSAWNPQFDKEEEATAVTESDRSSLAETSQEEYEEQREYEKDPYAWVACLDGVFFGANAHRLEADIDTVYTAQDEQYENYER